MIPAVPKRGIAAALAASLGLAALSAAPAPEYASLSRDKVFVREGPGYDFRVLWIYRRKDLPVVILTKYDVWRRIEDSSGTIGWVHGAMLSSRRTVVVTATHAAKVRDASGPDGKTIAFAQSGVVAKLEACEARACEILASGTEGWIGKQDIWGVGAGEVFK